MTKFDKSDVVDVLFFVSIIAAVVVAFLSLDVPAKSIWEPGGLTPRLVGQWLGAMFLVVGVPGIIAKLASRKTPSRFRLVFLICSLVLSFFLFLGTHL